MIINHLQHRFEQGDCGIAFFYCDYKEERTAFDLLSSLARQLSDLLLTKHPTLFSKLDNLYLNHGSGTKRLTLSEIRSLLSDLVKEHSRLFIVIDALDECAIAYERGLVVSVMKELCGSFAKVLITSRPNFEDINNHLVGRSKIDIVASADDIRTYLAAKILGNVTFMRRIASMDGLREQIVTTITNRASGM